MSTYAIELNELTKSFSIRQRAASGWWGGLRHMVAPMTEKVVAVDGVSFCIRPGERVAFIGPNGAGKSTTLKLLSGILRPDAGRARVAGYVPWEQRQLLAYRIGTVFGQRSQLWYHLPARDTFELLSYVYDRDRARHAERFDALVDAFRLHDLLDKPVRQLSLGERMRAEIVASLLHEPNILFLDEPTIGLDASAKAIVRDLLHEQSSSDGATLLLTSHDAGDIERVCERAIVIAHGRVLWDGSLKDLRRAYARTQKLTVWTECESLELDLPGVVVLERTPYCTQLELELGKASLGAVVERAQRAGGVRDLSVEDTALDDVIRAFYATSHAEAAT